MERCSKCLKNKPLSEFYRRKTGKRAGKHYEKCKDCMKVRGRNYYHSNRDRQLKLALIRRRKYRLISKKFVSKIKQKPCQDCGKTYPHYVMDFDHKIGEKKIGDIAHMVVGGWSLENIVKEIEKCDIVCANCHRIRTFNKPS